MSKNYPHSNSDVKFELLAKENITEFVQLCKQTWQETYFDEFDKKDLEILFGQYYQTVTLIKELKSNTIDYLVVCHEKKLIGYAKLSYLEKNVVMLDKLYLLNCYQNYGYGKALLKTAAQHARSRTYYSMQLTVWKQNDRAINFYKKKCGFKIIKEIVVTFGNKSFHDYLLEINDINLLLKNLN